MDKNIALPLIALLFSIASLSSCVPEVAPEDTEITDPEKEVTEVLTSLEGTVWKGVFRIGETNKSYEIQMAFFDDETGEYYYLDQMNAPFHEEIDFTYHMADKVFDLISEYNDEIEDRWFILEKTQKRLILGTNLALPEEKQKRITLKRFEF